MEFGFPCEGRNKTSRITSEANTWFTPSFFYRIASLESGGLFRDDGQSYLVLRKVLHVEQTNTVSLWASGAVAPMVDLNTLYEQQREQKLMPQLLQFLLFFKTENAELH